MARHPDEDELTALALGTLPGGQDELLRHLSLCPNCRSAYDDLSAAVDSVLPAAPALAAPAGFDARVLERLDVHRPVRRRALRPALLVAAAVLAGVCAGGVGATVLGHLGRAEQPAVTASDHGAALVNGSGTTVGTVEPSRIGDQRVVVMQIAQGSPGGYYTCRLLLKDGSVRDAGHWWLPSSGRATWIAHGAASSIDRVDLVDDSGRVWSSADLKG
ncbi:anti-sigma factor family protein [Streptomyces sp. NPDC102360]|uniref:anti-sigma factor family protein n=1 Tax=Streptomyces sp. NPDC102360 TaxID=3366160 RepID=UPI0037F7BD28